MYQVYVISQSGKPLMPTIRFGKVRKLLKSGKAEVISRKPFVIKLLYETSEIVQPLTLGIDPGANTIGVSVRKEDGGIVFAAELETRTLEVTENMTERKAHRMARRRNSREKQKRRAKKNNTAFEKKEYQIKGCEKPITCKLIKPGRIKFLSRAREDKWFAPTCRHLFNTHINFIKKISKILPIAKVIVEYSKFDIHKIDNPDVKGKGYQNGRMKGSTNVTEYTLCRDQHTCQLCKKKTGEMQVHHVIWLRDGGSDTPENTVTLCESCHSNVHTKPKINQKLKEMFEGIKKRYVHATILNSIMPAFLEWLEREFNYVSITYGYETKDKRREFKFPKTHWIDAYLISWNGGGPPDIQNYQPYQFKQFRRHNRANIKRQEDRKYYIGKTKVAVNRRKRTAQEFDSLKDLVVSKDCSILNLLTVKSASRPKRSKCKIGMGDIVLFDKEIQVVKGFMGSYLGFIGKEKYNHSIKQSECLIKNCGIVCL